ncbi:DUF6692 family protein [Stakelama pacifica]|uniref:DUF6692 domain-containing protein n=1 Tax=Stakelama pacifica TaxID=517720 RepID=A0A4R6FBL1_9SPHN|nr:DUF6692 family protein [Stakelama pacifica]TDN78427.1 hypothetical protein EV664_11748 [Stakelama pacifica]GGO99587.1 hypothetical protein GCM10011329_33430 [Stakelama pacifica]
MTRSLTPLALGTALLLGACNQNTAPGNDREAQVDPAPTAAPTASAAEALSGIATGAIQPETMNEADVASLGGLAGNCVIRLTGVAYPSFFEDRANGLGYVKLNDKLVRLGRVAEGHFADGDLRIRLRPAAEDKSDNGLPGAEMVIALPGAKDELGFRGYRDCAGTKTS